MIDDFNFIMMCVIFFKGNIQVLLYINDFVVNYNVDNSYCFYFIFIRLLMVSRVSFMFIWICFMGFCRWEYLVKIFVFRVVFSVVVQVGGDDLFFCLVIRVYSVIKIMMMIG